jgi:hypothetical protein
MIGRAVQRLQSRTRNRAPSIVTTVTVQPIEFGAWRPRVEHALLGG